MVGSSAVVKFIANYLHINAWLIGLDPSIKFFVLKEMMIAKDAYKPMQVQAQLTYWPYALYKHTGILDIPRIATVYTSIL